MIKPKALKIGDVVGVVAPSDAVEKAGIEKSTKILEKWGLKVKYGKHIYSFVGDFTAGTAEERKEDLKEMIFNPDIKAIWCASGGYAATEVLPVFDRAAIAVFKEKSKWLIGYSDICLLQNALTSFNIISVMGPTLWGLSDWDSYSQEYLRRILFGEAVEGIGAQAKWKPSILGVAEGKLVACDLETLIYSFGTKFDPIMYGGGGDIILAIEELDIDKSLLQRQIDIILNHKKTSRIKGMVVGRLVNIRELSYPKWGKKVTPQGLIKGRVAPINIPLAFCDDFGHAENGWLHFGPERFISLVNGVKVRLTVEEKLCKLEYLESLCQKD
jgi:muramoyltetrapeptide carboxypeptidase